MPDVVLHRSVDHKYPERLYQQVHTHYKKQILREETTHATGKFWETIKQ
jgi:hypothetical protein